MKLPRRMSIRLKLMFIMMMTSAAALLLACSAFLGNELLKFRSSVRKDMCAWAQILAEETGLELAMGRVTEAEVRLSLLRVQPNFAFACIFSRDGELLARYARSKHLNDFVPPPPGLGAFEGKRAGLEIYHPIRSTGQLVGARFVAPGDLIGSVYIKSDLAEFYSRLGQYLVIALLVFAVSAALALVLSLRLQRVISDPILQLTCAARSLSRSNNYDLHVEKRSEDEVGELVDGFNDMLSRLQERDAALQRARDELERRVEERTRDLERSNRELQAFAYVASHDLQEPLRKVQAFGDRLKAKCGEQLTAEGVDYLERMQNAARRMQQLINDLLMFSRVTTKPNPFQDVDLSKVVREVLSDLEIRIQQTNGTVEIGELPSIRADALQIRQLLQNLISNALKFHRPNVPPTVKVHGRILTAETGRRAGEAVRHEIVVEDNGIGFDPKYADRIFGVFQRLHGRTAYEGTGVGLAICRKIVERHGGSITASSAPNEGAVFRVVLPSQPHET